MSSIVYILNMVWKLGVVLFINFSLFIIIPASKSLFDTVKEQPKTSVQKKIVAEFIKPKNKEIKEVKEIRIRKVTSTASNRGLQNPMKFNITPDLAPAGNGDGVAIGQHNFKAEVFEEGDVDETIVPVALPPISFPPSARKLGIEGEVILLFVVDEEGKVSEIESIRAPHVSFAEQIQQEIKQWRFKPARKNGVPVKCKVKQTIQFSLK